MRGPPVCLGPLARRPFISGAASKERLPTREWRVQRARIAGGGAGESESRDAGVGRGFEANMPRHDPSAIAEKRPGVVDWGSM